MPTDEIFLFWARVWQIPDDVNKFQLAMYRYFIMNLIPQLSRPSAQRSGDILDNLRMASHEEIWSYSGCVSHTCGDWACYLNSVSEWQDAESRLRLVLDKGRKMNLGEVKSVMYREVPEALAALESKFAQQNATVVSAWAFPDYSPIFSSSLSPSYAFSNDVYVCL